MGARIIASILLFLLASPAIGAQGAGARGGGWIDPGWRRTLARYAVSFDDRGLSTTVYEFEYQAVARQGVDAIAQRTFDYSSYYQDVSTSDLATVKADGKVIAVDPRAVRDQPSSTDTSSPYFDESRVKLVAFPNVAVGDKVRGRVTFQAKRPLLPGGFAELWSQTQDQPPETIELTLDGPMNKPLQIAARGVAHTQEIVGDRIVHHVVFRHDVPEARAAETDGFDDANRFEASTFADYAAFAAAVGAPNARMAVPDDALTKLSGQIVGDATTPRLKAKRIYDWVAQNIRYVGIGLKDGGWVSQPAHAITEARYGDCKAHVTILKALLAAQGIEVDFTVVNTNPHYTLTTVASPYFNHAIAYIPSLDLYVDATASSYPFGALSPALYGKRVLDVDRGTLATIPVMRPEDFVINEQTHYTVLPNGTRRALSILTGSGVGEAWTRGVAQSFEAIDRHAYAARQIADYGQLAGTGDYLFTDPRDLSHPFEISAPFSIATALDLHNPTKFRLFALTDPRWIALHGIGEAKDEAYRCTSIAFDAIATLDWPDGSHLYLKPNDETHQASFEGTTPYGRVTGTAEVSRTVVLKGGSLISESRGKISFSAPVCPASFAAQVKSALDWFDRYERDPIGLTAAHVPRVQDSGSVLADAFAAYRGGIYDSSKVIFFRLATKGNADAQVQLGRMYVEGKGVEQDYGEALHWFGLAAAQNDPEAQSWIGNIYSKGLGVPQDRAAARVWLRKAAESGDAYAENALGFLYGEGLGGEKDMVQAIAWYEKAAAQGDVVAQANLGCAFQRGEGIPQDYAAAIKWYTKAAAAGSASAQFDLGLMYAEGRGTSTDFAAAAGLFRQAADQNNVKAEYNLGRMYERGIYFRKDKAEAIDWYKRAAFAGNAEAQERLDALGDGNGRSFFRRLLSFLSL